MVNFDDCKKGETSAKTGCTPQSGEGGKSDKIKKELSPADIKHRKSVEGKMKRAIRKVKSLEKSRQEMKKWHKGQPQGAIDKWNKAMDLEVEKYQKIAEISKKHLEKYYQ